MEKMLQDKHVATNVIGVQHLSKRIINSKLVGLKTEEGGRFSSTAFSSNLKPIINQKTLFF